MEGRRRGECEIRFMGRITAGITHEMRNVLAVIRESAGLIQDLMEKCQDVPKRKTGKGPEHHPGPGREGDTSGIQAH